MKDMINFQDIYNSKLRTAQEAIIENVKSNSKIGFGMAMSQPPKLIETLALNVRNKNLKNLNLYYFHSEHKLIDNLLQYDLMDEVHPHTCFMTGGERALIKKADEENKKVVKFIPNNFSQSIKIFNEVIKPDVFMITVSPMDKNGFFTFGTNNDYGRTTALNAKRLIIEVNEDMPKVFGQSTIHVSQVDAIVEHTEELDELKPKTMSEEERIIGEQIAELVPNGACLQMGIGGLPDAVCSALINHKDLGVHTELLTPGLVKLMKLGVINNSKKKLNKGKSVFTFAMGDKEFYEYINENLAIESHPVDYVNNPAIIAQNDNVISVNSTIEMDLTGECNSEWMKGHQFSATGGQLDFVRGASTSNGGKSIIAFISTTKNGAISKIVPKLSGPVTTPRTDVQYVVTEYGVANLKGLDSSERAEKLISLAHPKFREELRKAAREQHLI